MSITLTIWTEFVPKPDDRFSRTQTDKNMALKVIRKIIAKLNGKLQVTTAKP